MSANHAFSLSPLLPPRPSALPEPWREAALHGAEAFGWALHDEGLDLGPVRLPHPAPGAVVSLPPLQGAAEREVRALLALLRFFGGEGVRVRSRLNLLAFAPACARLQQALGLPVDPWFVLERELHEYRGLGGVFLLEVEKGEDPRAAARAAGIERLAATGRVVPGLPEGARPHPHPAARVYRCGAPPRPPAGPAPAYNGGMSTNPTGPDAPDPQAQQRLDELRRSLAPQAREDAQAVGAVLASVFRHCRGEHLRRATAELYRLHTFRAFAAYEEQPGRPLGFDYRVPVLAEEDLGALEAACRRHDLPFPPGAGQVHPLYLRAREKHFWVLEEGFSAAVLEEMARRMDEEQAAVVRAEVAAQKALRAQFREGGEL